MLATVLPPVPSPSLFQLLSLFTLPESLFVDTYSVLHQAPWLPNVSMEESTSNISL